MFKLAANQITLAGGAAHSHALPLLVLLRLLPAERRSQLRCPEGVKPLSAMHLNPVRAAEQGPAFRRGLRPLRLLLLLLSDSGLHQGPAAPAAGAPLLIMELRAVGALDAL